MSTNLVQKNCQQISLTSGKSFCSICSIHKLFLMPFAEAFKSVSHPLMSEAIECLRYIQPTPISGILLRPQVKFLLDKQSKHCSFTQPFWTELILMGLTPKLVVSKTFLTPNRFQPSVRKDPSKWQDRCENVEMLISLVYN